MPRKYAKFKNNMDRVVRFNLALGEDSRKREDHEVKPGETVEVPEGYWPIMKDLGLTKDGDLPPAAPEKPAEPEPAKEPAPSAEEPAAEEPAVVESASPQDADDTKPETPRRKKRKG